MNVMEQARDQATATAMESAKCFAFALFRFGMPSSMIDVGCGDGHLVQLAAALGIKAVGIDATLPREVSVGFNGALLVRHDLRQPFTAPVLPAELVLCLEVAEHIEEACADVLCATLDRLTERMLLFSAATPGQGGSGHVNEQEHQYWRDHLSRRGFYEDCSGTLALRWAWSELSPTAWWYGKNAMCFRRIAM